MDSKRWWDVFSLDPRSLALFRMGLGFFLLVDVWQRFPFNEAFLSDQGIATREAISKFNRIGFWSLNYFSGSIEFQSGLMICLAVAASCLLVGFGSRVATIACWVLVVSMHVRMPLVLNGGDTLLRGMLFWSLFLPLTKVWSLDEILFWKKRQNAERLSSSDSGIRFQPVCSMATVAVVFQICFLYWFAGIAKLNSLWFDGEAMQYALQANIYIKPFGTDLLEYPLALTVLSYLTPVLELAAPFALFVPWQKDRIRLFLIITFGVFHVGIWFSIAVGLFSLMSIVSWSILTPALFWNWLSKESGQATPSEVQQKAETAKREPSFPIRVFGFGIQGLVSLLLIYVTAWNVANIDQSEQFQNAMPNQLRFIGYNLGLSQEFKMFGQPLKRTRWFVYDASLKNGDNRDVLRDRDVNKAKPNWSKEDYPSQRWRKLHRNMVLNQHEHFRQPLANYVLKKWDREHGEDYQIARLRLICVGQQLDPAAPEGTNEFNMADIKTEHFDPFMDMLDGDDIFMFK